MSVKLRLKRYGRRHVPDYRLCAMDTRTPRDGRAIEELGSYNPTKNQDGKIEHINTERVQHWLNVGAIPSDTVATLLRKNGFTVASRKRKKPTKKAASA